MKKVLLIFFTFCIVLFSKADVIVTANNGIFNRYLYVFEWVEKSDIRLNCFNPGLNKCVFSRIQFERYSATNEKFNPEMIDILLEKAKGSRLTKQKGIYNGFTYYWLKYKSKPELVEEDLITLTIITE